MSVFDDALMRYVLNNYGDRIIDFKYGVRGPAEPIRLRDGQYDLTRSPKMIVNYTDGAPDYYDGYTDASMSVVITVPLKSGFDYDLEIAWNDGFDISEFVNKVLES